eukprot:gb/GECH01003565.1/.p1 GENE.gb/GECH01003565.1/~~gb/GECH01003565.1/.p1  ORF type:complete len:117 (+),score=28.07 gb/GECH01003565.1/:1-351(+)
MWKTRQQGVIIHDGEAKEEKSGDVNGAVEITLQRRVGRLPDEEETQGGTHADEHGDYHTRLNNGEVIGHGSDERQGDGGEQRGDAADDGGDRGEGFAGDGDVAKELREQGGEYDGV